MISDFASIHLYYSWKIIAIIKHLDVSGETSLDQTPESGGNSPTQKYQLLSKRYSDESSYETKKNMNLQHEFAAWICKHENMT